MKKTYILYFFVALTSAIFISSCLVEPKFPVQPSISFRSIKLLRSDKDSISVSINFQDGDGDLGLNSFQFEDPKYAPFQYFTNPVTGKKDSTSNPDFFNILLTLVIRNNAGEFEEPEIPGGLVLHGRFPRLTDKGKRTPLSGSITYNSQIGPGFKAYISKKVIKFKVSIKDRALHESNQIETDTLAIPDLSQ